MTDNELPPLPGSCDAIRIGGKLCLVYTTDQMHAYARAALAQRQDSYPEERIHGVHQACLDAMQSTTATAEQPAEPTRPGLALRDGCDYGCAVGTRCKKCGHIHIRLAAPAPARVAPTPHQHDAIDKQIDAVAALVGMGWVWDDEHGWHRCTPAPAPVAPTATEPWAALEGEIDAYLEGYELDSGEGVHTPSEADRFVMKDAIMGMLSDLDVEPLLRAVFSVPKANASTGAAHSPTGRDSVPNANAPVAEALTDAQRYRWLRSRLPGSAYRIAGVIYSEGGAGVDSAIDAAMSAATGAKGEAS